MEPLPFPRPRFDAWRERVAFEVRGQSRTFLDVVHGASARGELAPQLVHSGRLQEAELWGGNQGLEVDLAAVESGMEEFRYARDLVTVEETERWLADRGLGVDDLTGYFLRSYWHQRRTTVVPGEPTEVAVSREFVPDAPPTWPADLILSGEFTRLARRFAQETIACLDQPDPTPAEVEGLIERFRGRNGWDEAEYQQWLARSGWDEAALVGCLRGQERYEAVRRSVLTEPARRRAVVEMRERVAQAELELVEFDVASAAQEAFLCVTTDRMPLEAVAQESGYALRRQSSFLRDLPESWRLAILSAPPGRVLPPLAGTETFSVVRVIRRRDPGLEDPAVAAEVEAVLLQRHFGEAELREVRWQVGRGVAP